MTLTARPPQNAAVETRRTNSPQDLRRNASPLNRVFGRVGAVTALVGLAVLAPGTVSAATPTAEDGFAPGANAQVLASAFQPDGKIIVGGYFTEVQPWGVVDPLQRGRIARINADGSIDGTFNPNANGVVRAILLQPDGKIVIGGDFTSLSPNGGAAVARSRVARLNADGTVDATFNPNVSGTYPTLTMVDALAIDSSGRILVGGEFNAVAPNGGAAVPRMRIARFNADGTLDAAFNPAFNNLVTTIAVQPDGNILVGGGFTNVQSSGNTTNVPRNRLARLSPAGVVDATYNPSANDLVNGLAFQVDGKVIAVGNFTSLQPNGASSATARSRIVRLNSDGSIDPSFGAGVNGGALAVAIAPDGRIIVSGSFRAAFSTGAAAATRADYIARIAPDGTVDGSFFPGPSYTVNTFALQSDGKIFIGGNFTDFFPAVAGTNITRRYMARLNQDGTLDASLNPSVDTGIVALTAQSDGRILVGGNFASLAGITRRGIARISANGAVEAGFDPSANAEVSAIAVQSDGKIIVGGSFTSFRPNGATAAGSRNFLARLNADGTVDTAFNPNPNGSVRAIVVQSDGKIMIGGGFTSLTPNGATDAVVRAYIARLNSDGTVDTAFNPIPDGAVVAIQIESDGKYLIGGSFGFLRPNEGTVVSANGIARLNSDGTVVASFAPNANNVTTVLRLQTDGKILVSGAFTSFFPTGATQSTARNFFARLNADGTVDSGFDPKPNGSINVILPLSDGKIIVGGGFTAFSPNGAETPVSRNFFARLNSDGTVDTAFDPNPNREVVAVVVQSTDNLVVAGGFTSFRPAGSTAVQLDKGLARITPAGAVDLTFSLVATGGTGEVRSLAYQSDGSMVVGGSFTNVAGSTAPNMVRLRSEGIYDTQFAANPNGSVEAILPRPAVTDTTTLSQRIGWLLPDGKLKSGLNIDPNLIIDGTVESIVRQSDGKFLIGGMFAVSGPIAAQNLIRLNTDGSIDTSFNPQPNNTVAVVRVRGDGKILIFGSFSMVGTTTRNGGALLNSDGSLDSVFNPNITGAVNTAEIQGDGKILIGGAFTALQPNGSTTVVQMGRFVRLNSDGTVDTAFNPTVNAQVDTIAIQGDGKILIGGLFTSLQPNGATTATTRNTIARVNSDGTLDTAFDPNGNGQVRSIRIQSDGKISVAGGFTSFTPNGATSSTTRNRIARLNTDGTLDTGFDPNVNGLIIATAIEADGSILIGGVFTSVGGVSRSRIARVSPAGMLDTNFNPNAAGEVRALLVLSDGSMLAGGTFSSFRIGGIMLAGGAFTQIGSASVPYLALLSADGTPVPAGVPSVDGTVRALARHSDGRVVLGGEFATVDGSPRAGVARLLSSDTLDTTFTADTDGDVHSLAVQVDDRILIGGSFTMVAGGSRTNLARVNSDGSLDAGFTASTDGRVDAILVQPDGKIIVAGSFGALAGSARTGLGRLNSDGSIDGTFAPAVNGPVSTIAIQSDGAILIGGSFTSVAGTARAGMAKLDAATGALDASYDPQPNGAVSTLLVSPDGKVFVGGAFTRLGNVSRYLVGRLSPSTQSFSNISVGSDKTSLNWLRDGSAPEIRTATFEVSTNGREWTVLGAATRDPSVPGWRIAGVTLPTNTLFFARARANLPSNRGGSGSLLETVRVLYVASSSGGTGGSNEPPEVPPRPAEFLAETYLSANPDLANTLFGLPDRLDLAWVHYWTNSRSGDTEQLFFSGVGQGAIDPRLKNLSARAWVGPGDDSLIMGVIIADAPARLLVRALGPSLAAYQITNPLPDPAITVYSGQSPIASSDDWQAGVSVTPEALSEAGVSMADARDAAMVVTLQPGAYTFVISSKGANGVGLGELFLLSGETGRLVNLSARANVGEGGDILIGGFYRQGVGELLLRGIGPELATHNVTNHLANPVITLHRQGAGSPILSNDDWGQVIGAISDKNVRAGAVDLPEGSKDSAAYVVLGTGGYTIHVTGAQAGQKGVALVEVFELR